MKTPSPCLSFLLSSCCLFALCAFSEAPFLQIDINAGSQAEQEGWHQFGWPTGAKAGPGSATYTGLDPRWTFSGTPGEVTFTLSAGATASSTDSMLTRNRSDPNEASSGFPLSNVYRDFINTALNTSLWISLSGLTPNTPFDITLILYDFSNNRNITLSDYTYGTAGATDAVRWTKAYPFDASTPPNLFSVTLPVRSDPNGTLLIRDYSDNGTGAGLLSGLTLTAVPSRKHQLDLCIDFGIYNSYVQHAFSPFGVTSGIATGPIQFSYAGLPLHTCSGTLTLTLAGGSSAHDPTSSINARDREIPFAPIGSFTWCDLYRDTVINRSTNQAFWLEIEGFNPNEQYILTFYAYDNSNARTMTFTDFTSGEAGASGSISFPKGYPFAEDTPNDIFSTTLLLRSDATGRILVRETPSSGGAALINGLRITHQPPTGTLLFVR